MKRILLSVLFFVGVVNFGFGQDFFAVINGDWNDGATWGNTSPGTEGVDWPSTGDDVSTEGFQISFPRSSNFSCNTLFLAYNVPSQLIIKSGRGALPVLTIQEAIISDDGPPNFVPTAPNTQLFDKNIDFIFTGEKVTGFSALNTIIGPWSASCQFGDVQIDQRGSSSVKLDEIFPATTSISIVSGQFEVLSNGDLIDPLFTSVITVNSGTSFIVDGSVSGDGTATTKFKTFNNQGNVSTGGSGFINAENITLGSGSTFSIIFNGANQTEGWWYQTTRPLGTFNVDPSSTIIYSASANQNIGSVTYGNLRLESPVAASTKTLQNSNSLVVQGTFTINSANVTFNSTTNPNEITLQGNVINGGAWEPSQLVIYSGAAAQTISGSTPIAYNGGVRVSNTTGVSLSNIGADINGLFDIDPSAIFNPGDQIVSVSGNMQVDGTLNAGTNPGGFVFDGTTSYLGSGSRNFYDLTISGTMTAPTGTLNINGNFRNNGTFNNNSGTLAFAGADAKSIGGSNTTNLFNIAVNGGTVSIDGTVNLENVMTFAGSPAVDFDGGSGTGVFTLKSTSTRDAAIGDVGSATFSGNLTVERHVVRQNANNEGYHIMSFPVAGVTVADLQQEIPVNGNFTGASGYTDGTFSATNPSIYRYIESVGGGISARYRAWPTTDNLATFNVGEGYHIYTFESFLPRAVNGTGALFRGGFSRSLSYTGSEPDAGWHAISNPYPAPTDWSLWGRADINAGTAHLYDPATGNYIPLDGTSQQLIPQGQGFFVKVNAAGSITASEATKVTGSTPTFYRNSALPLQRFEIVLRKDTIEDVSIVSFNENATDNYESTYDADRLLNVKETLSTLTKDGKAVKVNRLATGENSANCSRSIFLNLEQMVNGKEYELTFRDLGNLPGYSFTLVDHFLATSSVVQNGDIIPFTVTSDAASKGSTRFELVFANNQPSAVSVSDVTTCFESPVTFEIATTESFATYYLYKGTDLLKTLEGTGSSITSEIAASSLTQGINALTLKASNSACDTMDVASFNAVMESPLNLDLAVSGSSICSSTQLATYSFATEDAIKYYVLQGTDTVNSVTGNGTVYEGSISSSLLSAGTNTLEVVAEKVGCGTGKLINPIEIVVDDLLIDQTIAYFGSSICEGQEATFSLNTQSSITYEVYQGTKKVTTVQGSGATIESPIPTAFVSVGENQFTLKAIYANCEEYTFTEPFIVKVQKPINTALEVTADNTCEGTNSQIIVLNADALNTYSLMQGGVVLTSKTGITTGELVFEVNSSQLINGDNQFEIQISNDVCGTVKADNPITISVFEKASLSAIENRNICANETVSITAESSIPLANYQLLSNGSVLQENSTGTFVVTPTLTSTYEVKGTTDKGCVSNIQSFTVSVEPLPDLNRTVTGSTICANDPSASFSIATETNVTYHLLRNSDTLATVVGNGALFNGTVSTEGLSAGSNSVEVFASKGSCTGQLLNQTAVIEVQQQINTALDLSTDNICAGGDSQITIFNTNPMNIYTLIQNGNVISSKVGISAGELIYDLKSSQLVNGVNEFEIEISNDVCGAVMASNAITITVYEEATISGVENSSVCRGEVIDIAVQSNVALSNYQLISEQGTVLQQNTTGLFNLSPEGSATYSIKGSSASGCESNTIVFNIAVDELVKPEIAASANILETSVTADSYQWYKDGQLLEGETGAILIVNQSGNYIVEAFKGACSKVSAAYAFDEAILSASEKLKASFTLYPNPIEKDLVIEFTDTELSQLEITIFTLTGQFVNSHKVKKSGDKVDLGKLNAGTYLIQVNTEKGSFTQRIIKK